MLLWFERSESYYFSNLTSEASCHTSPQSSGVNLLWPGGGNWRYETWRKWRLVRAEFAIARPPTSSTAPQRCCISVHTRSQKGVGIRGNNEHSLWRVGIRKIWEKAALYVLTFDATSCQWSCKEKSSEWKKLLNISNWANEFNLYGMEFQSFGPKTANELS